MMKTITYEPTQFCIETAQFLILRFLHRVYFSTLQNQMHCCLTQFHLHSQKQTFPVTL